MKKLLIGCTQILLLCGFTYVMGKLSGFLHLQIPGSIIGFIVLFILLQTKIVKLKWIEVGGSWLVTELLLFFIPSAVGMIHYRELLLDNGLKIIFILIVSSSVVMICSGLVAEKMTARKESKVENADTTLFHSHR
ncbi:CidA/LrgA family holin-like protein [Bacillus sp. Bva_UNVM-123]|uniref:CidA/LrgA family protein n=1 Tax=Bacillus sp. Bva_UNVM-123 TaxID=2829798 RepID=UPI00391F7616